jgi:hypothetical protein
MAKDTNITINTNEDSEVGEIIIRHGDAPKVYDPIPIRITGQITAPRKFYDSRKSFLVMETTESEIPYFHRTETHVIVDRHQGHITLIRNESDQFREEITGRLEFSPEYEMLGINGGKSYQANDLAKLLRQYRYLFPDRDAGMRLVTELAQFRAVVTAETENSKDQRGNKKNALAVAVDSNVPLEFQLRIPIFKGFSPVDLKIEIALDSRGHVVDCFLESPEALQTISDTRDLIFDEQLNAFLEDGITVIEI